MKRIQILAAVFFAGSFLFAGCTKDNMDTLDTTAITNGTTQKNAIAPFPMITYKLAATPMIKYPPIQWNTGYMTVNELIFQGTHLDGNMLNRQTFQTNTNTTVNLFEPAVLGTVAVPFSSFNYGMFSLQLEPALPVKVVSPTLPKQPIDPYIPATAFSLSGTFNLTGTEIPVQVTISTQVMLTSAWLNNITTGESNIATLTLDIGGITNGITSDMLANAQQTNGIIFITNSSNENLYGVMLKNLQNNMLQVQYPSPSPNPNVSIPTTPPNSL